MVKSCFMVGVLFSIIGLLLFGFVGLGDWGIVLLNGFMCYLFINVFCVVLLCCWNELVNVMLKVLLLLR